MNNTFDPQTLANDLCEVHRIYKDYFSSIKTKILKRL